MFAVLETTTIPSRCAWTGARPRITYQDKPEYIRAKVALPLRARNTRLRKLYLRALRTIQKSGAAGIVLPKDFPFPELAEKRGLAVSSAVPLLRRLAAQLCGLAIEENGFTREKVRVTLLGTRPSPELLAAAGALASSVRALYIDAGEDTGAACYLMRSRYGISALGRPPKPDADAQDVFIVFDRLWCVKPGKTFEAADGAVVLNLTGGVPALSGGRWFEGALLEPPRSLWKGWPLGCDTGAMLAALLATEQVSLGDIRIRGLVSKK